MAESSHPVDVQQYNLRPCVAVTPAIIRAPTTPRMRDPLITRPVHRLVMPDSVEQYNLIYFRFH
jgi:hypothetical protein